MKPTFSRILVAVEPSLQSYDALETAAEFASHLKAHLMALFIEDVNLLKLAELPFAKELDRSSGVMRPLEPRALTRALQADAQKLQKRLAEESERRQISVSMKVVRGQYLTTAIQMAEKSDIVFLNDITTLTYDRIRTGTPRTRRIPIGHKPIWIFYDGSTETQRCLALALSLAQKDRSDLLVVFTDSTAGDKLDSQRDQIARDYPDLSCQFLPLSDKESLGQTVEQKGCSVLVLPRTEQYRQAADSSLSQIKCPRILV
ncbi:MAG: universal stress protein [Arenicellales bacterium]|nr:universal stress protein [Arenicellales bacterium]